jgi:hypothetical protein
MTLRQFSASAQRSGFAWLRAPSASTVLAIGCLLTLASSTAAQTAATTAIIRGRVLDSLAKPIANAEVVLVGTPYRAVSGASGAFVLRDVGEGRYRLVVRRVGYQPIALDANIAGPDTLDADVVLARATNTLDSVLVTADRSRMADFEANRRLGFGTFFPREEIERRTGSVLHTLLRTRLTGFSYHERPCGGLAIASATSSTGERRLSGPPPSVGAANGCRMPDLCYVQLYVDGIRMFGTNHVSEPPNIDEYQLDQLEGIEVYSSASATPPRYATMAAVCGTVALWRRQ